MSSTIVVLLFLFSAGALCQATTSHPNLLSVLQPSTLIASHFAETRGGLNATLAYYGHLNYGSEQITRLFVPGGNSDGCNEFKLSDFLIDHDTPDAEKEIQRVLLRERAAIMVRRGACSFVKKSLNIQRIGGKVAVISDNIDEVEENLIMIDMNK